MGQGVHIILVKQDNPPVNCTLGFADQKRLVKHVLVQLIHVKMVKTATPQV